MNFIEGEAGDFRIEPKTRSLKDFYGIVKTDVHATLEDMEEGIARGAAESVGITR